VHTAKRILTHAFVLSLVQRTVEAVRTRRFAIRNRSFHDC